MLRELSIENLAVIQRAEIPIAARFNVFTGETGAGKSILIHGINAVLGQRVTRDLVRAGENKAVIHALFTEIPLRTREKMQELGVPFQEEDDQLMISREILADGGSVARVNGRVSTVSVLRELGETLINIHGQHDSQMLLAPDKHLGILDGFGGLEKQIADYQRDFKKLQEISRQLKKLVLEEQEKARAIERYRREADEIGELDIQENEDVTLEEQYALLQNSDRLLNALQAAGLFLAGLDDDPDTACVVDLLEQALGELSGVTEFMSEIAALHQRLASAKIEIQDIAAELIQIADDLDFDPMAFQALSERRRLLDGIKRLYGPELSDVLERRNTAVYQLSILENATEQIEALSKEREALLAQVTEKAKALTAAREKAGRNFVRRVTEELAFLNMPGVRLEVFRTKGKLTMNGMDNIEFLISANPGEPPKPMAKIASGGELSRIMLALKSVIAGQDDIPTLIFDEIDTGVSGRAAQKIGVKLAEISRQRQVLCVTHLAQLAIQADNHLLIEKQTEKGRTITRVQTLDWENRQREIARIMGGDPITPLMLENARALLETRKYPDGRAQEK